MMATSACPAIVDLFGHPAHVCDCTRCGALQANLAYADTEGPATTGQHDHALQERLTPSEGEVWAARGFDRTGLALVRSLSELSVVAVSYRWRLALDTDMVLDSKALGFGAIVRTRLCGSLVAEQLDERVGTLSTTELAHLRRGPVDDAPWGPSVLAEDDPRNAFADDEAIAWSLLTEPAQLLTDTLTLGDLVSAARQRRAIGQDELAESMAFDYRHLASLEADDADLLVRWPPTSLGALFRKLGLIWCAPLADRIRAAVEIRPANLALPAAFHRRSQGRRDDATAYTEAVAAAMTGQVPTSAL
jgi:hypothetical protein